MRAITLSNLKKFNCCPFCSCKNTVDIVRTKYQFKNKKGYWYKYKCSSCLECFTTTESDTLSQEYFNKKHSITYKP